MNRRQLQSAKMNKVWTRNRFLNPINSSEINAAWRRGDDAAKILSRLILFADLDKIEEDRLVALAAERTGGGVRAVAKMIGLAREEKSKADRKARRERERAEANDNRPDIYLSSDMHRDLTLCEEALIGAPNIEIFQRGGFIVHRGLTPGKSHDSKDVLDITIALHGRESLRIMLAQAAHFHKEVAEFVYIDTYPPAEFTGGLLNHPDKNYLVLRAIIATPTLRADGTLLTKPGYDDATGLYFDNEGIDFGSIPENPTYEDARAALDILKELIRAFPFVDEASLSVALARFLTGPIRPTLKNAPLFAYSAPEPRTGKSKLNDIGAMIEKGHEAPVISASENPEEFEKQLTTSIMSGATLISLDNIDGELRSPLLCQMLTQVIVSVRAFGQNEKLSDFPSTALIVADGNQLVITKDLTERTLLCRLDAKIELPGSRVFDCETSRSFGAALPPWDEVVGRTR